MIVKNESKVIGRCLSSVQHLIDYWVIVDTGSTDGTQQLIPKILKSIPGELHERPWVNFGHNRNEAYLLAKNKADYTLFIDADERLIISASVKRPALDKDCYRALVYSRSIGGLRTLMVNNELNWQWEGVIHEEIKVPFVSSSEDLQDFIILADAQDGCRSQDPDKFLNDAKILEKAIETDPENARYMFYLAQSYTNGKDFSKALHYFEKRAVMKGEADEIYWSLLMIGIMQYSLNMPSDVIILSLWKAHQNRPSRAEPLYFLALIHFTRKEYDLAYFYANIAVSLPCPQGTGFVIYSVYDYEALILLGRAAQQLNKREEAVAAFRDLTTKKGVPDAVRKQALSSLKECCNLC